MSHKKQDGRRAPVNVAYLRLRALLVDTQEVISERNVQEMVEHAANISKWADALSRHLVAEARETAPPEALRGSRNHIPTPDAVVRDRYGRLARRHEDGRWGAEMGARCSWPTLWDLYGPLEVVGFYPEMTAPLWLGGLKP